MEVTFSEGGTYKFACYRLTYEESKSPDRIAKIKADLASKGKDGYSIAITYDASPTPPTWDNSPIPYYVWTEDLRCGS